MHVRPASRAAATRIFRWLGRASGLAILFVVALFMIGEGPPPLSAATAAFMTILAGFVAGWFSDAAGAVIVLGGMAAFCGVNLAEAGRLPGGLIPLFVVPGVLHLAALVLSMVRTADP